MICDIPALWKRENNEHKNHEMMTVSILEKYHSNRIIEWFLLVFFLVVIMML